MKSSRTIYNVSDVLIATIVFIVPSIIWRIAVDPIDLVKGTFLWILAVPAAAILVTRFVDRDRPNLPRIAGAFFGGLGVAAVLATVTSMNRTVSVFGQYQRYTGLLTILCCLLVTILVADMVSRQRIDWVIYSLVASVAVVVVYGLIQEFGLDPLEWAASSFNKLVFSTLGNPNTASAFLSSSLPIVFATFLTTKNLVVRFVAAILLGLGAPLLGAFTSFQGQVGVVAVVLVVVAFWRTQGSSMIHRFAVLLLGSALIVLPQLPTRQILFLVGLLVALLSASFLSQDFPHTNRRVPKAKTPWWLVPTGSIVVGGIVLLRDEISRGLSGGLLERGDFYRAALANWRSQPIFGSGLETFGYVFGEFRPESHAVALESSRTSSVHSIYLGMFSNGGIVLGLAYLVAMGLVAVYAFRLLRISRFASVTDSGIVASWLGFQVISLVSVEHVALFLLNFVLCGLIIGRLTVATSADRSSQRSRNSSKVRHRRRSKTSSSSSFALLLASVLFVVGLWQLSRPLRAANASYSGLQSYYSTGISPVVIDELERAVSIAPWEAIYKLQLAESYVEVGDYLSAEPLASRAAEQSFYQGGIVSNLASIVFDAGNIDRGIEIMEEAVKRDPFAPTLRANLVSIKVIGAQQYLNRNDLDRAKLELQETLLLDPDVDIEGLDQLRAVLGL
jgi:hypothetical protein